MYSVMSDSATPRNGDRQAPLSMGFPRKESRVSCHFLLQGTFSMEGLNLPPGKPIVNEAIINILLNLFVSLYFHNFLHSQHQ